MRVSSCTSGSGGSCDGGGSDRNPCDFGGIANGFWRRARAGEAGDSTTADARWARCRPWQNRDKTHLFSALGKASSEEQIPQVVENPESGDSI